MADRKLLKGWAMGGVVSKIREEVGHVMALETTPVLVCNEILNTSFD